MHNLLYVCIRIKTAWVKHEWDHSLGTLYHICTKSFPSGTNMYITVYTVRIHTYTCMGFTDRAFLQAQTCILQYILYAYIHTHARSLLTELSFRHKHIYYSIYCTHTYIQMHGVYWQMVELWRMDESFCGNGSKEVVGQVTAHICRYAYMHVYIGTFVCEYGE